MKKALNIHSGFIIGLILLIALQSHSQRFVNFKDQFSLGYSDVLFEDSYGFLWIGSKNGGLYKFDGHEIESFAHDINDTSSISGNNINAIGQDGEGKIWVGVSGGGLNILNLNQDSFSRICLPVDSGCSHTLSVNAFARKSKSEMWVGTNQGLYLLKTGEHPSLVKRFTSNLKIGSLSHQYISDLKIDSDGKLWIGTVNGINLYQPQTGNFIHQGNHPQFPAYPILDIEEDRNGKLYISTRFSEARLYFHDDSSGGFLMDTTLVGTKHGEFTLSFDLDNNMWISSRGMGAFCIHSKSKKVRFFSRDNQLRFGYTNFFGTHTICDKFGNIWMAGESLLMLPNTGKKTQHFTSLNGKIHGICRTDKVLWFSGDSPKRLKIENNEIEDFLPLHIPTNIRAKDQTGSDFARASKIMAYRKNKLLFCFMRNILIWDTKSGEYTEYPLNFGGPFKDMELTDNKNQLWICNNLGSPLILDLNSGELEKPKYTSQIKRPNRVIRDPLGNYWFSTVSMGVFKMDPSYNITRFTPDEQNETQKLPQSRCLDLAISNDTILWVATNIGVFKIDIVKSKIIPLQNRSPLLNLFSIAIILDNNNKVWASTKEGIIRHDPLTNETILLDQSHGIENKSYSLRSAHKDGEGTLYFGGDRGIDIIFPDSIGKNNIPPDLYIKEILINNHPLNFKNYQGKNPLIELSHHEDFIDLELIPLHLTSLEANNVEYNIPEVDTLWRSLNQTKVITLASVAPGTYSILARASNLDGVYSDMKKLVTFQIHPPWWKTYWFIGLVLVTISLFVGGGIKYRINTIKDRERLKTSFNKRLAEVESRALRAQMNPHFLFNSINAVNSLISRGESKNASIYLRKFSKLIRLVLSNSQKPLVRLQDEIEALQLYLEIEQLRFQNFEFEMNIDSSIDQDFVEVPPLLLQPYVENAIWHGLLHKTEGQRRVKIEIWSHANDIKITIEDNGIGRERAQQLKTKGAARKKGLGMQLTKDRLDLLGQLNNSKINTKIEDLKDQNGRPSGTLITIQISPAA